MTSPVLRSRWRWGLAFATVVAPVHAWAQQGAPPTAQPAAPPTTQPAAPQAGPAALPGAQPTEPGARAAQPVQTGPAVLPAWAQPSPGTPTPGAPGAGATEDDEAKKKREQEEKAAGYRNPGFPAEPPKPGAELAVVRISGFLAPQIVYSRRDAAVPQDRVKFGLLSARLGLRISGNPFENWSYFADLGFDGSARTRVVTGLGALAPGDRTGTPNAQFGFISTTSVDQATITYRPTGWYSVSLGRMFAPFSVGAGATVTAQMFPTRPGPASAFMIGADEGLLNTFTFLEDRVQVRAGAFNGSSLGFVAADTTAIGPLLSGFVDLHPLGRMPAIEGDNERGRFRFAAGVGTLYRIGTLFDATGYEATRFRDFRLSTALRIAFRGLFLQGEFLRRLQTDDLSLRPSSAHGYYVQGAYYVPFLDQFAISPIARWGRSVQDREFSGQEITSYEGGVAFYPRADGPQPNALKLSLLYAGEHREPAQETAHGGIFQLLMRF
jgi:hypothetical protein